MNKLVVNQFFGLGDIIYVQELIKNINREIIYPIADEYFWIVDYLQKNSSINFIKKSQCNLNLENPVPSNDYLPLRWATQVYRNLGSTDYSHDHTVMEDKYLLLNQDPKSWGNYEFVRNIEKENKLYMMLGCPSNFTLVNNNYGSNTVGFGKSNITLSGNVVNLSYIDGFTMFDWIKVIEEADEIHTISTSLVYLCDKYAKSTCKKYVYIRNNDPRTLDALKNILNSDWNYCY